MAEQIENRTNDPKAMDWASAFEALDKEGKVDQPADPDGHGDDANATAAGGEQMPGDAEQGIGEGSEVSPGDMGSDAGVGGEEDDVFSSDMLGEPEIEEYKKQVADNIRSQAILEIGDELIKRGVRNTNGKLGATIEDSDICKRDEDGIPHFYNPETGQEFQGDNPRRQAQEWVDDYNKELARVFDDACEQYEKQLHEQMAPQIAVREFAPKYAKLDGVRRALLDNVIEDYEITDEDGDVIGYTCDLDKALALVNRQIASIQNYAKANGQAAESSGPALDMKTSSGAISSGDKPAPTSLAEALEREQDMIIEKNRR